MTSPKPDGSDAAAAIKAALDDAELTPDDIDYINAHGTGTKTNDSAETNALKLALGDRAVEVPVSATKSMTGHTIGASGALEAIVACLSLRHQTVHPTINLDSVDPECELNHVADGPRPTRIRNVISNSFGIGSNNAVLVFGDPDA
jgi:3-oxoacyl-[acyl-carrier-protein] synthase II